MSAKVCPRSKPTGLVFASLRYLDAREYGRDMDAAVVVALVTGILGIIGSVITAFFTWARTADAIQIRSEWMTFEDRIRSELAKELALSEARLRVEAESKIHLVKVASEEISAALAHLEEASSRMTASSSSIFGYINKLSPDAKSKLVASNLAFGEQIKLLQSRGTDLPPALLEHYDDAIHAFNECNIVLMRLGGYAVSKLEVTDEAFSAEVTEPIANARDALESFRLNARHWKVQQWEQLAAPLPPQVSRLSSAPTKALSVGQRATRTPQRTGQDE